MTIFSSTKLTFEQKQTIFQLWNTEYPRQLAFDKQSALDVYLDNLTNLQHLFYIHEQKNVGWAFSFEREQERWFAIIVHSDFHHKGIGSLLLNALKETNPILNGWVMDQHNDIKLDVTFYKSPLTFYTKNEFQIISETRLETDKLSAVKINWTKK